MAVGPGRVTDDGKPNRGGRRGHTIFQRLQREPQPRALDSPALQRRAAPQKFK